MDVSLVLSVIYGIITWLLDGVLWGVSGYLLFRLFGCKDKSWLYGAVSVGVLFVFWGVLSSMVAGMMLINVGNEAISGFLGEQISFGIDAFDLAMDFLLAFAGFKLGQQAFKRIVSKR
ncbi:hypothetical protein HYV82_05475 [Candidatus Woesearchaeota archaeon]|nr:hypothetical protein [Candidatus Woesearchaeota archaeon]